MWSCLPSFSHILAAQRQLMALTASFYIPSVVDRVYNDERLFALLRESDN